MKKIIVSLVLLAIAALANAQTGCTTGGGVTCSPNLNLWLLPNHYQNWGVPWNSNATELDTFSQSVALFNPTVSQTITQPLGTYFNVSHPMVFGTTPALVFGVTAGAWDAALTRTAFGTFSIDTTTFGNHLGNLSLNGLKLQGAGGTSGQCLGSDGTYFDVPVNCITSVGSLYYQTVELSGAAQTQRPALNFGAAFSATDSASPARTNVDLANVGTAGTYASPASITFDVYGRETAITASAAVNRVCNANGCYRTEADGTIEMWGISSLVSGTPNSQNLTITFPTSFSSTTNLSLVVSASTDAAGDGNPHAADCHVTRSTLTTAGATSVISWATTAGSGYANLVAGDYCSWHAWGI